MFIRRRQWERLRLVSRRYECRTEKTGGFYPVAKNNRKGSGSSKLRLVAVTRIERVTRGL
jgi:hypothetical protein